MKLNPQVILFTEAHNVVLLLTISPPGQYLQDARTALSRAQTQTHEAFQRYTACLEAESRARRDVVVAEQHRDELSMSTDTYQAK